ncbi:hypothetical protein SCLCIDRAFT_31318 [Scleroderma citrinum Foug A]|uniref:Uncharacterized protein n=1 Tax=Scleroderma citrinum Foug A TaxID=1036808 RepID=A0A0C3DCL9_9AGAM|nr:hypothetical protein SCLCIDRAFT_31318 [Scleroderma citrinum Foug A]
MLMTNCDGKLNNSDLHSDPSLEDQDFNSDSSDWVDLDQEVEDIIYDEMLDEEMELEHVVLEDGTNDGFDSNTFHNF